MEELPLCERYEDWPPGPERRAELARELFAQHLVAAYNGWLKVAADMLFEGYRHKSPTEEQRRFLDWINALPDDDRQMAFALVQEIADGVVFSILVHLDGATGRVVQERVYEEFRIVAELYPRHEDGMLSDAEEPVERLPLPLPPAVYALHELWPRWLKRWSRWSEPRA